VSGNAWTGEPFVEGGPWRVDRHPYRRDRTAIINRFDDIVVSQATDPREASLIALAPEMADAILAYANNPSMADHRTVKEHDAILALAEKLRAINTEHGGDDE
jgi:phosphopantothenoylcysteine synthetase/decarboxylase